MTDEAVTTNYNDKGTIIMEMIYGDDYLSPGGVETSAELSRLGEIKPRSHVVDLGSGLGGAAFFLAQEKHCSVVGVDLMAPNVADANRRASAKGLTDKLQFEIGDATQLNLKAGRFDVVWGQDAWCHIDDKPALIAEAHRLLKPGGRIVFSDWLLGPNTGQADEVREVTASSNLFDSTKYQTLLDAQRFDSFRYIDQSREYAARYEGVIDRLHEIRHDTIKRFETRVFDIVMSKQQFVFDAFQSGALCAGYFTARKTN